MVCAISYQIPHFSDTGVSKKKLLNGETFVQSEKILLNIFLKVGWLVISHEFWNLLQIL